MNTDIQLISGRKMLLQVEDNQPASIDWVERNKSAIDEFLTAHGAILIRGLRIQSSEQFRDILKILFEEDLASYTYRSTPRTELVDNVYTATEYHPSEVIPQHSENSYAASWPMRIGFLCMTPAVKMGNTPIADNRLVYQEIPKEIRDEFERKKIMYVRNYSKIDLPWQEVFQTQNKEVVEKYCQENNMQFEWTKDGGLRTKQVNQASLSHPITGEMLWFNQAHLFHVSSLESELAESLLELLGEENLPRNTYFGDGTPIDAEALSTIRKAYDKFKFSFKWEKSDLLLLDNMLFTHGREPFEGPRQVFVGMARVYSPTPHYVA